MVYSNEIITKEIPDMLIASIRFKGKYSDIGREIGNLYKYCGRYAVGKPFSLYYDEEFRKDDADKETAFPNHRRTCTA
jgi:hypothetical protein